MATETQFLSAPHPYLREPILYIADLPKAANHVSWQKISSLFSCCGPVSSGGKLPVSSTNRSVQRWKLVFQDVFFAEMALVTMSGKQVPGISPPWHLSFSHSLTADLPLPKAALFPLYFKFNESSSSFKRPDEQTLFQWLRGAGPLYALHLDVDIGRDQPVCVVEYWEEEHVQFARQAGAKIHTDAANVLVSPFRAFDPWNLYCAGMGTEIDTQRFLDEFQKFGDIITGCVRKPRTPGAYGFVSFVRREDATRAMHELRNESPWGQKLTIRYHEPQAQQKLRPHLSSQLTRAAWYQTPATDSDATAREKEEREKDERYKEAQEKAAQEAEQKRKVWEQEIREKEERERKAWEQEVREAARRARESMIEQTKVKRSVAELVLQMAIEAAEQSSGREAMKLVERATARRLEGQTEAEFQLAKNEFEKITKLYNAARTRLAHTREASEKATLDRKRMDEETQVATQEREAAEVEKLRAKAALTEAIREEQNAVDELEKELTQEEKEEKRRAELAESIRKMAELREQEEADRREREAQAREEELQESRRKMEELEQEERRRKHEQQEAEKRAREAARKAKEERERKEKEEAERKVKEQQEKEAREKAEVQRKKKNYEQATAREKARCRKRDELQWPIRNRWLYMHALARFRLVSTEFDNIKFCDTQPLTFESIPWPLLHPHHALTIDKVEWQAVEDFFAEVEYLVNEDEYRSLVEKTHRRFHPDKWRSRGLLNTILDESLRTQLETAGNTVAQAMTPIWSKSRSK